MTGWHGNLPKNAGTGRLKTSWRQLQPERCNYGAVPGAGATEPVWVQAHAPPGRINCGRNGDGLSSTTRLAGVSGWQQAGGDSDE
ncbi:hypothetical protein H8959_013634 [Pygathrix nigripes]